MQILNYNAMIGHSIPLGHYTRHNGGSARLPERPFGIMGRTAPLHGRTPGYPWTAIGRNGTSSKKGPRGPGLPM